MTHTPRHKAQKNRKQYVGSSRYTTPKKTYSPDMFIARFAGESTNTRNISKPKSKTKLKPKKIIPKTSTYVPPRSPPPHEVMPTFDPIVHLLPTTDIRYQPPRHVADSGAFTVSQQERVAQTIAQQEVAQVKAQRDAEANAVIAAAARDYHTRTQAVHYDSRQLKYQQYGDDRGSVVGRNIAMQGVQAADADRKFQTTSQRLPTGGYIRQTQHAGVEVENMWQLPDGTVTDKYREGARYIGNYPATHTTIWYSKDDTPESRMQPATDSIDFWNSVADRASDPAESYYRNNLADAAADKWEQIRNRQDMGIVEANDTSIMRSLEKFYKETEHGLTPDDIGFEIIIPDDKEDTKDDTKDDTDSTVVVPTAITTSGPGGGGAGGSGAGGGGWDWGGYGSGGYGNYGGNVYNITYGNRGYEQRIDPWAYGMVQWRI